MLFLPFHIYKQSCPVFKFYVRNYTVIFVFSQFEIWANEGRVKGAKIKQGWFPCIQYITLSKLWTIHLSFFFGQRCFHLKTIFFLILKFCVLLSILLFLKVVLLLVKNKTVVKNVPYTGICMSQYYYLLQNLLRA